MAVTRQGDRRKGNRRESDRRKGDIKEIKIEGVTDKEKEVTVRREAVSQKREAQCGADMKNLQLNGARA